MGILDDIISKTQQKFEESRNYYILEKKCKNCNKSTEMKVTKGTTKENAKGTCKFCGCEL